MTIKPIETRYKGYRFRSRLEARWAVFFDALGVAWGYEKEGMDLGADGYYLPDFWLPSWESWVEIKPLDGGEPGYLVKPTALAWCHGQSVILIMGSPWPGEHLIDTFLPGADCNHYISGEFASCRRCEGVCLLYSNGHHPAHCCAPGYSLSFIGPHSCGDHDRWPNPMHDGGGHTRCAAAYRAARSARFEHGEGHQ